VQAFHDHVNPELRQGVADALRHAIRVLEDDAAQHRWATDQPGLPGVVDDANGAKKSAHAANVLSEHLRSIEADA
jgi:hypothetical protein